MLSHNVQFALFIKAALLALVATGTPQATAEHKVSAKAATLYQAFTASKDPAETGRRLA